MENIGKFSTAHEGIQRVSQKLRLAPHSHHLRNLQQSPKLSPQQAAELDQQERSTRETLERLNVLLPNALNKGVVNVLAGVDCCDQCQRTGIKLSRCGGACVRACVRTHLCMGRVSPGHRRADRR